jgi:aminoglycoside phosphotransferase (APT) family kinase protein
MADVLAAIAVERRDAAVAAIASVTDPASVTGISPTTTRGASGASTFRVEAGSDAYLLRLEVGRREGFRNPKRSYPCLRAAAEAGIAPAVHHADEDAGVVLMDFIVERPQGHFPGGQPALIRALGEMVARLQATAPFPLVMADFGALIEALLNFVRDGGLFAPGVLDGHVAGLARVRAEYPWTAAQVSAHHDINPRNVLFDGARLWLVDWELAFRNDPLADLANIANNFSDVPDVDALVLEGWLGRSSDDDTRHRLALMRDLHRLFSGCVLLAEFVGRRDPEAELSALTRDEFRAAIGRGELRGTPELLFVLGKMNLVGFSPAYTS